MRLSDALLDYADAEYYVNTRELVEAALGKSQDRKQVDGILSSFPTAAEWFDSLSEEGQKRVTEYLQRRHGCNVRFSM